MNSRDKGKRGEREFADLLREHGFDARRGQQFAGGAESPDVVSEALAWLHFEVKRTQALSLADACAQAEGDAGGKPWVVAHRRNHAPWLVSMRAELFFELIREFQPRIHTDETRMDGHEEAQSKVGDGRRPPLQAINVEAWVGADCLSGEVKAESGNDGGPKTEDEHEGEDDFPVEADAAAGSSK